MKRQAAIISPRLRQQWLRFFSGRPEIKEAILFGSRARNDASDRSDIDLSISAPQATERQWLEISAFLEEESLTLLPLDIVRWESAPKALKSDISRFGKRIYVRA